MFALLHDLTNCLRIADVTKFTAEMPMLVEVKTNPNRLGGRQVSRMKQAIAVINDGAPLRVDDVDVELLRSHQQFHTRVRELPGAFERASSEGLFVLRLGTHWVAVCRALGAPGVLEAADVEAKIGELEELRRRGLAKADMAREGQHHLRGNVVDRVGKGPAMAPFTIFPFDSMTCALLTCDLLSFETIITWDRVASEFGAIGFETRCPLPQESDDMSRDSVVLEATRRGAGAVLRAATMDQILFELAEPRIIAAAVGEFVSRGVDVPSAVFTFRNERAVWR